MWNEDNNKKTRCAHCKWMMTNITINIIACFTNDWCMFGEEPIQSTLIISETEQNKTREYIIWYNNIYNSLTSNNNKTHSYCQKSWQNWKKKVASIWIYERI